MTAARRTLEETVAAIRDGLQYLDATNAKADRAVKAIDDLLAIAQGQREEIAAMRKVIEISRICANEGGYKQCHRTDDHHIALMEMDAAIKAIGTKK